jgi:hypothetical protein
MKKTFYKIISLVLFILQSLRLIVLQSNVNTIFVTTK